MSDLSYSLYEWRLPMRLPKSQLIYIHSFQIFIIQIGEMAFCKRECIIMKSNYFQNVQKGECFLVDFEAVVRECRFRFKIIQTAFALVRERRFRALLYGREMSF
jgi:hypothetical protein